MTTILKIFNLEQSLILRDLIWERNANLEGYGTQDSLVLVKENSQLFEQAPISH